MTDEQKQARIKEIDDERCKLAKEKQEYIDYFKKQKEKNDYNERKKYIGKCYRLKPSSYVVLKLDRSCSYVHTVAFKIISLKSDHYAKCLALYDSDKDYGIIVKNMALWSQNKLIPRPDDPRTIDDYEEISEESFNNLYNEMLNKFEYKQEANNENK